MPSAWSAIFAILSLPSAADYDSVKKIEHARLYGNVDQYAYYFVDLVVGTPPQRVSVILDTGSGVCAYPCANCGHCGHHIDPAFDIAKSSTASWLQCKASRCPVGRCSSGKCSYYQGYTEGSSISGFWFEDMVSLGDMIQHNPQVKARMGCHSNENNLFYTQKANGIMGIGPSALDREYILDKIFKDREHISHKVFSICLSEWGGQFNVGGFDDSYHTGPMVQIQLNPGGFYGVSLTQMKVGGTTVNNFGSTMIDSGTTYTYMKSANYKSLANAIEKACGGGTCGGTKHGRNCWKLANGPGKFPTIKVFFNSVETKWVPQAYFYRKGKTDTYCYGFEDDGPRANTVLGAVWMMHKEIVFDLENRKVGIAPAKCPEHKDRPSHIQDSKSGGTTSRTPATTPSTTKVTTSTAATTAAASTSQTMGIAIVVQEETTSTSTVASSTEAPTTSTSTMAANHEVPTSQVGVPRSQVQKPEEAKKNSGISLGHEDKETFVALISQHPFQFVGAVLGGLLVACLFLYLFKRYCLKKADKHRHVQLKEDEESGMPPQIVGAGDAGFDAFVIGDDEAEHLEDGFSYEDREDEWAIGGLGLQQRDKDSKENGPPLDLLDTGNAFERRNAALD